MSWPIWPGLSTEKRCRNKMGTSVDPNEMAHFSLKLMGTFLGEVALQFSFLPYFSLMTNSKERICSFW